MTVPIAEVIDFVGKKKNVFFSTLNFGNFQTYSKVEINKIKYTHMKIPILKTLLNDSLYLERPRSPRKVKETLLMTTGGGRRPTVASMRSHRREQRGCMKKVSAGAKVHGIFMVNGLRGWLLRVSPISIGEAIDHQIPLPMEN